MLLNSKNEGEANQFQGCRRNNHYPSAITPKPSLLDTEDNKFTQRNNFTTLV